jgi:hypothetical protein
MDAITRPGATSELTLRHGAYRLEKHGLATTEVGRPVLFDQDLSLIS